MPSWLESGESVLNLDPEAQRLVLKYTGIDFDIVWTFCHDELSISRQHEHEHERVFCQQFVQLFKSPASVVCPTGLVLFEGQSLYEKDLLNARAGQIWHRRRPTSATWNLNAVRRFLCPRYLDSDTSPSSRVLLVHHVIEPEPNVKALVVQQLMFGSDDWHECEVILEPDIVISIFAESVEPVMQFREFSEQMDSQGDEINLQEFEDLRVLHTFVTKAVRQTPIERKDN
jgi:hypothetical protein